MKNRRSFLRKTRQADLALDHLRPGARVTVMARLLEIRDFGDEYTRRTLSERLARTFAMVKPHAVARLGEVLTAAVGAGFRIANLRLVHLTREEAGRFYAVHRERPFFGKLCEMMSSGPAVALELVRDNAVAAWRDLLGPTDPAVARVEAPRSLRALIGEDVTQNACHGSDAADTAEAECAFFFGSGAGCPPAAFRADGSTAVAVALPAAVAAGGLGGIVTTISEHLEIVGAQLLSCTRQDAADCLEVYRGVIPSSEFDGLLHELASGPSVVLEVAHRGETGAASAVPALRELCGPRDPELARLLRPDSLRATFGRDRARPGVHCTDLEEDGALEADFWFRCVGSVA